MAVAGRRKLALFVEASPEEARSEHGLRHGVGRRAALQGLAASLGAAFAAPAAARGQPHPVGRQVAERAPAKAPPASGTPQFLDSHQFATLAVVADLILPGAAASDSPRFIDSVLAIERHEAQRRFIGALGALDAAAREQHQRAFKDLPRDLQVAVLEAASTQPPGRPAPTPWKPGDPLTPAEPAAHVLTLRDHFDHLKGWVAGAHYSSEAGMKELGWTGAMFFAAFPGCSHPDGHQ